MDLHVKMTDPHTGLEFFQVEELCPQIPIVITGTHLAVNIYTLVVTFQPLNALGPRHCFRNQYWRCSAADGHNLTISNQASWPNLERKQRGSDRFYLMTARPSTIGPVRLLSGLWVVGRKLGCVF